MAHMLHYSNIKKRLLVGFFIKKIYKLFFYQSYCAIYQEFFRFFTKMEAKSAVSVQGKKSKPDMRNFLHFS